jgi:hypothetical protein
MLKNFISFFIILLVTFFLVEISSVFLFKPLTGMDFEEARLQGKYQARVDAIGEKVSSQTTRGVFMLHPYLGYVHSPNEGVNNYGMLSKSFSTPYKKLEDEFVIAVIGGSVASRFATDMAENHFLQKALVGLNPAFASKKTVVIPLSAGGFKQPQHLFALQYALLLGFEFDLVINLDGYNDLVMATLNYEQDINPAFPSGFHMAVLGQLAKGIDYKLAKSLTEIYDRYESEYRLLTWMKRTPLRQSRFMNLLAFLGMKYNRNLLEKAHYEVVQDAQKETPIEFKGPTFDKQQDKYKVAVDIWKKASIQTHAICLANNIKYLHVLQPNQYVKGSKVLSQNEKKVAYIESSWSNVATNAYQLLIEEGHTLNQEVNGGEPLLFRDMTMVFKDIKEDLYFDDCCHFNARGNEILSKSIAQVIMAKKLYPKAFDPDGQLE